MINGLHAACKIGPGIVIDVGAGLAFNLYTQTISPQNKRPIKWRLFSSANVLLRQAGPNGTIPDDDDCMLLANTYMDVLIEGPEDGQFYLKYQGPPGTLRAWRIDSCT